MVVETHAHVFPFIFVKLENWRNRRRKFTVGNFLCDLLGGIEPRSTSTHKSQHLICYDDDFMKWCWRLLWWETNLKSEMRKGLRWYGKASYVVCGDEISFLVNKLLVSCRVLEISVYLLYVLWVAYIFEIFSHSLASSNFFFISSRTT